MTIANLDKDGQKNLSEKLETIKPLWDFQEGNYSNPQKVSYLNAPTQLNKKGSVDGAFEKITKTLAAKTAPEHLAKAMPSIAAAAPNIVGSIIATQCTQELAKQSKYKLDQKVKDKILDKLEKDLSTLDPKVLGDNSEKLISQISSSLKKNHSFFSYFTGNYDISSSSLDKIIKEAQKETEKLKPLPSQKSAGASLKQSIPAAVQQTIGASVSPAETKSSSVQPEGLPPPPQEASYWKDAKPHSKPTHFSSNSASAFNPVSIPISIPVGKKKQEELDMPNHPAKGVRVGPYTKAEPPPMLSHEWGISNNSAISKSQNLTPPSTPPSNSNHNSKKNTGHSL